MVGMLLSLEIHALYKMANQTHLNSSIQLKSTQPVPVGEVVRTLFCLINHVSVSAGPRMKTLIPHGGV
jgi:hypothetical protein